MCNYLKKKFFIIIIFVVIFFLSLLSRYAWQYLEENSDLLKPIYRFQKWKETTVDEIKAFFALLLSMGLVHQQDLQDYWSLDPVLSTPFFH